MLLNVAALALLCGLPTAGPEWIGYGGPMGTRVFADAKPPRPAELKVKWQVPLPSWGHGMPLAYNGRVYLLCETGPRNLFPLLVCLDGATGKTLWAREVDHLSAVTDDVARQEALRKDLKAWFEREAELILAFAKGKDDGTRSPSTDKPQGDKLKELYAAMGLMRDEFRRAGHAVAYECMGDAYGTPVTDGRFVYVATLWGGFACYDFDGKQQWVSYARSNRRTWCNMGRSPIMAGDLLLYNGGGTMRALDKATGKLRWQHEDPEDAYGIVSPAVITVGGQKVLLAAGPSAYRLPDGQPLKVEGWVSEGMQILVKSDEPDVAYFCGSGEHCGWKNKGDTEIQPPAAFRFTLDGNTLRGQVLWQGGDLGGKPAWGGNIPWMVYDAGKFYHRNGAVLDGRTGKVLAGAFDRKAGHVPATSHLLAIAGGHIYGLRATGSSRNAVLGVYTLDGKQAASIQLTRSEPTPDLQAVHTYCTGDPLVWTTGSKARFGYGNAFTFDGDRMYVRSLDEVICLGK